MKSDHTVIMKKPVFCESNQIFWYSRNCSRCNYYVRFIYDLYWNYSDFGRYFHFYMMNTGPNRLSVQGEKNVHDLKGLEKYMLEFSNMKEYELPHLELWKDYLVYATMMGISDKIIKRLKLAYPNIDNDDYMTATFGNTYFYWMFMSHYHYSRFRNENFASGLGDKLTSISTAATRIANPHLPEKVDLADLEIVEVASVEAEKGIRRRWWRCPLISKLAQSTALS